MFKPDISTSLADLKAIRENLLRVEEKGLVLTRQTADRTVDAIRNRVQQRGLNADGDIMLTRSPKKLGRYSESHGRERQQLGLQTGHVDLTMTGQLLADDSWTVIADQDDGYGGGFTSGDMADRASYLEDYYGDIFRMSDDEQEAATDYFNNALAELMTFQF